MEKNLVKNMQDSSHLSAANIAYVEQLYDAYLKDPSSVTKNWREYFDGLAKGSKQQDSILSDIRAEFLQNKRNNSAISIDATQQINQLKKQAQLEKLINAYRVYGHQYAKLDPLGLAVRQPVANLQLGHYGFSHEDLDVHFSVASLNGYTHPTLRSIQNLLLKTYCDTLGAEYMHISNSEEVRWLQQRLESVMSHPKFSETERKQILSNLIQAENLEKYLGAKYVGQTRFSLEGGSTLIPVLNELVHRAGVQGVKELIIGMGHRGRLNVLVNVLGKPMATLTQEFEGKSIKPGYSGDVKYHSGYSSNIKTKGGVVHLALTFNPSHLEIIDPVVEGSVRARQDRRADYDHNLVVPVLIHGDAAFAGQGVVMETFSLSQPPGFTTGGTVHIVVNNQIGFTTSNPKDARSSEYCTDIAKMVEAPIFHVNADDPEMCIFALQVAFDFRMIFKKDVIIDLVCYRRLGHNEADEPSATQPTMYRVIKQHPRTPDLYAQQLIAEKIISETDMEKIVKDYRDALDNSSVIIPTISKAECGENYANWIPYKDQVWNSKVKTAISKKELEQLGKRLTEFPEGFVLQAQVAKEYDNRRLMLKGEVPFNWGFAETLAYASLVKEGYPVRLTGQDCGRGTFSHRHAVLHDQNDDKIFTPLQHIADNQAQFTVIDSVLSEEAVLGFEYGYATTDPETLVIWEAQYGDFMNGAQVVIDQFITSGEQKWSRLCGLVMFLPHGYEGAGPEHSSARLERFLQSSAQKNIQVCIPTTPAQTFHMLRRQLVRPYRKPLIVFTPKSLLRNKLAVSTLEDLTAGEFKLLIPEIDDLKISQVKKVILCSGKVYYDLLQTRRDNKQNDVAIIRIEQLYPFPKDLLVEELARYKNAKQVVWCQEEPKNQGAWYSINHRLIDCLAKDQSLAYAGRPASASPATGYSSIHAQEQAKLVKEALEVK